MQVRLFYIHLTETVVSERTNETSGPVAANVRRDDKNGKEVRGEKVHAAAASTLSAAAVKAKVSSIKSLFLNLI